MPAEYTVVAQTDSQLIVCELTQGWQVKAANLRLLVDEAAALLQAFGVSRIDEVPRTEIVRVLGH